MSEITKYEKGFFEILELRSPDLNSDNSKANSHDHSNTPELEHKDFSIEFLIQDMFLDHFFP